jgi:aspartate aminotransferase/aminotransferase
MKPLSLTRQAVPGSPIREVMELALTMEDVLHLEVGTPNYSTPGHVLEAAARAMQEGFTRYTANAGFRSLRRAIADKIRRDNRFEAQAENVLVTAGSGQGLLLLFMTLADAGEEVLIPDPAWTNYEMALISQQILPRRYPLRPENGYLPDVDELHDLVTHDTKALVINSPSNPTGAVFPRQVLLDLYDFAREHDLYLVSDETYEQIVFEGEHVSPAQFDTDGRVISVYSFSKGYAMTGWRVGYLVAPVDLIRLMTVLQEPIVSCACSVSQKAAEAALTGPQDVVHSMVASYRQRRDAAMELVRARGLPVHKPAGAFYLLVDISSCAVHDARSFALSFLQQKRVAVAPGTAFGDVAAQTVRVCLAAEEKVLMEGLERLCRYIKEVR